MARDIGCIMRLIIDEAPTGLESARAHQRWAVAVSLLMLAFAWPLYDLVRFSYGHELYSHIILVPLMSGYLARRRRREWTSAAVTPTRTAMVPIALGTSILLGYGLARLSGMSLAREDHLAGTTSAFVLLFTGLCGVFLGGHIVRGIAFPLAFLAFMVPFPVFFRTWLEGLLQAGSAEVAHVLFSLSGTPVFREDLVFHLPNVSLEVARQCSGIHSTLALFIVSILAGYWFIRSGWGRAALALTVPPLALMRNGFRVFTIGELCVRSGPEMLNSYIHRHGGPLFFALSLIPFSVLLFLLVRLDRRFAANRFDSR